jgi:hypothetical protein
MSWSPSNGKKMTHHPAQKAAIGQPRKKRRIIHRREKTIFFAIVELNCLSLRNVVDGDRKELVQKEMQFSYQSDIFGIEIIVVHHIVHPT